MAENKGIEAEVFIDVSACIDTPDGKRYTIIDRGKGQQTPWEAQREEQMRRAKLPYGGDFG